MEFSLFDKAKQQEQRQKLGNLVTAAPTAAAKKTNALLGSRPGAGLATGTSNKTHMSNIIS